MLQKVCKRYRIMVGGNGLFYPVVGFASIVLFIYMSFGDVKFGFEEEVELAFVERNGTQFMVDGKAFYINGWNSYWLMVQSVDEYSRPRVREMLKAGAKMGLTVCRTWAFNDGDYNALQSSPGVFNEQTFKTILTRKNTITGIEYRNDPAIFGWELINEPRCMTDPSGDTLQDWIEEMSAFVKLIDKRHLVTVGLEGFYGPNDPKRLTVNPEDWASRLGSDFIRNSLISNIDFTSVHIYPDHWFHEQVFEDYMKFVSKWMLSHIEDGDKVLNKPVVFSEFGLSDINFTMSERKTMYKTILDISYKSAKKNRSGGGCLVWQFLVGGMQEFSDDFGIIPWEKTPIPSMFIEQSCRLAKVKEWAHKDKIFKQFC
ncbi:mannan endo-1,4-beta-mannosidase 2 isoform X2 [Vigna umbellata]|uniref:mannan endo-1,4-beta-mannosidase 2 isoform X2 n=1 Tax=Vigna umbellata TaxID=87088 RepID=UPI001F5E48EF|nr:mannan endo-1,4-beta-mannosidase 2 isoform X2 [Vigna umbellata]